MIYCAIKEDLDSATLLTQAVAALREDGPSLGRPLVDRLKGSRVHHLKELGQALEDDQGSGSSSPSTRPAQHSC